MALRVNPIDDSLRYNHMEWSIQDLLDEKKCYNELMRLLHDDELKCAKCRGSNYYRHSHYRDQIDKYRCRDCGHVFHLFSGTALSGTRLSCSKALLVLRGFAKGQSTRSLARELSLDRTNLLALRHRLQDNAFRHRITTPLNDEETETDECYQNAGEKGVRRTGRADSPRRRANKKKGLETTLTTAPASWARLDAIRAR